MGSNPIESIMSRKLPELEEFTDDQQKAVERIYKEGYISYQSYVRLMGKIGSEEKIQEPSDSEGHNRHWTSNREQTR